MNYQTLSQYSNYESAMELRPVDATALTEADFIDRFVKCNQPCLLKGAAHGWPAMSSWQSLAYLKNTCADREVSVRTRPTREYIDWVRGARKRAAFRRELAKCFRKMPLHGAFHGLEDNDEMNWVLHAYRIAPGRALEKLAGDIGDYPFLPVLSASTLYPTYRSFIYKRSYTDWHYHPADETLMTQIVGAKNILLLPPDRTVWTRMRQISRTDGCFFNAENPLLQRLSEFPALRCTAQPGDALYIPPFWWHAVETVDSNFGITVASTFRTPAHVANDLRIPAVRLQMREQFLSKPGQKLLFAGMYRLLRSAYQQSNR
jgi:hypothetical protein